MAEVPAVAGPERRKPGGPFFGAAAQAALLTAGLTAVAACATLPDSDRMMEAPHDRQVAFEGAQGPVSTLRSDILLSGLEGGSGVSDVLQKHLAYEQAVNAASPLVLGNRLTLLQNGPATYQAMFAAIREAQDHINLETYIFDDDEIGRQFADLLLDRQAAGVQVNIIYDSVGGLMTPAAFYDRLRDGGIQLLEFNPVMPLAGNRKSWLLNNRDHRKQLVIDGRTAFIGGINISDSYSSAPRRKHVGKRGDPSSGWRDTHVRIEGPVVAEFQKLFMDTWARQKGDALAARAYFPDLEKHGEEIVRAIGSTPDDAHNLIYLTLMSAISHAELQVHVTIAYFAPDPQLLKAFTDAAQRGVDVRLILPSHTDSWPIFHLGRSHYTELLRGGVKIHERRGAVMHAKTAYIDGVWSTIGSTNLDWRSFLHNDEINAVIVSRGFAAQMQAMFAEDLAESDEITLEGWRQRSWMMRLKEQLARVGAYWL
jgi:cardiolipin synthase A/B